MREALTSSGLASAISVSATAFATTGPVPRLRLLSNGCLKNSPTSQFRSLSSAEYLGGLYPEVAGGSLDARPENSPSAPSFKSSGDTIMPADIA